MANKPLLIFSTVDITRLSTLSYDKRMNLDMPQAPYSWRGCGILPGINWGM